MTGAQVSESQITEPGSHFSEGIATKKAVSHVFHRQEETLHSKKAKQKEF